MIARKKRVCILTTVHPPFDIRIFHKQAKTLARAGYDVTLIAQNEGNKVVEGIRVIELPKPRNRFARIFGLTWQAFRLALRQRADFYHFHDPELLPIGVLLKLFTLAKVIYDVHEDVPRQILSKHWIPRPMRKFVAKIAELIEFVGAHLFDGIVAATPTIAARFPHKKTVTVQNFPISSELIPAKSLEHTDEQNLPCIVYVGGLSITRGIKEMVQAMALLPESRRARLALAGMFQPPELEVELKQIPGWQRVQFLGWQDRNGVAHLLSQAQIGLVTLHPIINYLDSYPVKLFEYMAAGLPVIASNFPLWREIVAGNNCGLCVDPLNPEEIAQAIEYLLDHPEERQRMGENGRRAVLERYNWEKESEKLLALYEKVLKA